jgi:hypothetical protein
MCDYSGKLIAWLDRELPEDEAAAAERHLDACSECRAAVDAYKRVSSEIEEYCDAAISSNMRRREPLWVPVVSAVGAVAAVIALFLVWPRTPVQPPLFHPSQVEESGSVAVIAEGLPAPVHSIQKIHRHHAVTLVESHEANPAFAQSQNANGFPDEPVIQIAIPADEMFPPGAVPEGMHFAADLTISADGSAERLRLRPRLAGFERRTTQP